MLQVESILNIPNKFTLFIEADHFRHRGKII